MLKATQTTGKEGELRVIGELLKRGFEVYTPLVDIVGIDCVIRTDVGYREIQVKTRESAKLLLFDVKEFTPRDNFFIICYNIKEPETFWVIPSKVYKQKGRIVNARGHRRIRLVLGDEDSKMRRELHQCRNNFFQFKEGTEEAAKELKQAVIKTGWQSLKQRYPSVRAVEEKLKEAKQKKYSPGYIKILENLKRYWQKMS